jgi:hypothetical protein
MAETNPWAKLVLETQAKILNTQNTILRDQKLLAAGQGDPRTLNLQITRGQEYIVELQQLIDTIYQPNSNEWIAARLAPPASAGNIVNNANLARDNNANATRPVTGQQVAQPDGRITPAAGPAATNAQATPTTESNPTTGTNPDGTVRTAAQTQAVNNQSNQPRWVYENAPGAKPSKSTTPRDNANTGGPGAAAPGDNNTPTAPSVLINKINNLYDANHNFITERPNILDDYYSYTYSLSWYLVDPQAWKNTIQNIRVGLNGYYLLARSGGNPLSESVSMSFNGVTNENNTNPKTTASRSPYFKLDYYLDNLNIETGYGSGIDTSGPMEFLNLSFTVTEPNGLTLPKNLYAAVADLYSNLIDPNVRANYAAGMYCMAIRFYGYDEAGKLVQPITSGAGNQDPNAVVEKFVFFQLASLEYSMTSKAVEYKITGATPSTAVGFSASRGSIPFNAQFTGATVKDVLVGQIQQVTATVAAGDATRNGQPVSPTPAQPSAAASAPQGPFTAGGR